MYNSYSNKCQICKKDIRSNELCCIICPYCHDSHQNSQLPLGICPKMQQFISLVRPSDYFPCPECDSEGKFTKITKISYYETTKKYQCRVSEWEKQNRENCPKPQRKLLKQEVEQIMLMNCGKCEGTGRINRVIPCKQQTCRKCVLKSKSRLHINPQWGEIHRSQVELHPTRNGEVCTYCRRSVQFDGKRVWLPCSHILHGHCYQEVLQQGSCAACYTPISWRQVQQAAKNITEKRLKQTEWQQKHINDDSFCIRKGKRPNPYEVEGNLVAEGINNLSFMMGSPNSEQDISSIRISSVFSEEVREEEEYYI